MNAQRLFLLDECAGGPYRFKCQFNVLHADVWLDLAKHWRKLPEPSSLISAVHSSPERLSHRGSQLIVITERRYILLAQKQPADC